MDNEELEKTLLQMLHRIWSITSKEERLGYEKAVSQIRQKLFPKKEKSKDV
jgi:hypothetical protein